MYLWLYIDVLRRNKTLVNIKNTRGWLLLKLYTTFDDLLFPSWQNRTGSLLHYFLRHWHWLKTPYFKVFSFIHFFINYEDFLIFRNRSDGPTNITIIIVKNGVVGSHERTQRKYCLLTCQYNIPTVCWHVSTVNLLFVLYSALMMDSIRNMQPDIWKRIKVVFGPMTVEI